MCIHFSFGRAKIAQVIVKLVKYFMARSPKGPVSERFVGDFFYYSRKATDPLLYVQ